MSGMKLIVSGATGFVGQEIIRQSLSHPNIAKVVALARSPITAPEKLPEGADASKLKSVVIQDYAVYPDEIKKEFSGADACIWYASEYSSYSLGLRDRVRKAFFSFVKSDSAWQVANEVLLTKTGRTVAITPSKAKMYDSEVVKRICQTSAIAGLRSMHEADTASPFRFLYMSGAAAERDQSKTPKLMAEYSLMRGDTENQLLALASDLGDIELAVAKPGYITASGDLTRSAMAAMVRAVSGIPSINVVDLVAAMIDQVVRGFEKEPLMPEDLIKIAGTLSKTT